MKQIRSFKFSFVILAFLLLFFGRFFLTTKLFDTHDIEYHAARTANYYLALQQGQVPPRWSPNLNYSFGLPTFLFAYPLPYMVATVFYLFVDNIQLSINLALFLFWCIGGVGMFYYAKTRTKRDALSLLVAMSYFAAPYTLLNFFERGAFGETSFYALLPLVLLILHWQNKISSSWFVVGSYIVLVTFLLTHPQSLVLTVPVLGIWTVLGYTKAELKKFWQKKIALLVAVGLSVQFFWTPLVFEAKETFVSEAISLPRLLHSFPVFSRLFWPSMFATQIPGSAMLVTSFTTTLGLSALLLFLVGIYTVNNKHRTTRQLFWLTIFLATIFLMHPGSSFIWSHIGSLKVIQFPWRLLSLSVLASSMLFIECQNTLIKKRTLLQIFSVVFFCISLINLFVWGKPKGYISRTDYDWFEYFGTASSFDEFIPKGFVHEKNLQITDKLSLIPAGESEIVSWNGSRMEYRVNVSEPTQVLQKTAYFPGWKVFVDNTEVNILHNTIAYPGRITFALTPGDHLVTVIFTNQTPIRQAADTASLFGLGLLFILLVPTGLQKRVSDILQRRQSK
ncbi:MAG: hypothetical protein GW947_02520 [Candidatus Pacebacteria bacterium]|nr:hypothetical protein [Candidatus Paceibacterota bacterium]PIR61293.1 MAG: hypothetical protein COU68_00165 [Candidatus Pacebacteria bacterium CG10_big_fil_rev_8_21_14_0_10_45_6]